MSITEVSGIKVGSSVHPLGLTGVSVVLCEKGAVGGVSVMGGAPGTRETDLLRPSCMVDRVNALFFAGGSAFGLDCASGVVRYLEEVGAGFDTGIVKVPIVCGAIIFDLGLGKARPTPEMAYEACKQASRGEVPSGSVGAGAGATVGKMLGPGYMMKSGLGNASLKTSSGDVVGAMVIVNAYGDVYHPGTGRVIAGAFDRAGRRFVQGDRGHGPDTRFTPPAMTNTTVGVVAVDGPLTKQECDRVAIMAMGGLAQTIRPCFTPFDGDTLFVLATGRGTGTPWPEPGHPSRAGRLCEVGVKAQEAVALAIVDGVTSPGSFPGVPSHKEVAAKLH